MGSDEGCGPIGSNAGHERDEWSPPAIHALSQESELVELRNDAHISRVIDPIEYVADDLYELRHPDQLDNAEARAAFVADILEQGVAYGKWVHYAHENSLVRFADSDDHYALRTSRNRKLIESDEQDILRQKKVAAFGLSVGSNVVDSLVQTGIGTEYLLFDFDRLSISNLNRIRAGMSHVGLLKTTIAGRKIAALDTYIGQQHFPGGYDDTTDDVLRAARPDVIVEEVDDMQVKARLRRLAAELGVPLVMAGDVADKSTLDIERHDLGEIPPFNGKLTAEQTQSLVDGTLSSKEQEGALIKMMGIRNLSPRLIESAMARGSEVAGLAQLGTTATIGGAITSVAIRDIFLGRKLPSGTNIVDIRKSVGSSRPTTLRQDLQTFRRFKKYRGRTP